MPSRLFTAGAIVFAGVFLVLGIWQIERRAWKHALVAAVDARVHAAPAVAPGPDDRRAQAPYRRITVSGHFLTGNDTLVRATTELGSGYWVMTPFDTGEFIVLVNRGFVTPEQSGRYRVAMPTAVTGLLRPSEPHGGFLRSNDPADNRWYSRDILAIASARRLAPIAPYFIDADGAANGPGRPVGGLTVVHFADNHLSYALTWFALAGLALWGAWRSRRGEQPPA